MGAVIFCGRRNTKSALYSYSALLPCSCLELSQVGHVQPPSQAECSLTTLPSPPTDPGSGRPSSLPGSSMWAYCWSSSGCSHTCRHLCSRTRSCPRCSSLRLSPISCDPHLVRRKNTALCNGSRTNPKEQGVVHPVMSYHCVIFIYIHTHTHTQLVNSVDILTKTVFYMCIGFVQGFRHNKWFLIFVHCIHYIYVVTI